MSSHQAVQVGHRQLPAQPDLGHRAAVRPADQPVRQLVQAQAQPHHDADRHQQHRALRQFVQVVRQGVPPEAQVDQHAGGQHQHGRQEGPAADEGGVPVQLLHQRVGVGDHPGAAAQDVRGLGGRGLRIGLRRLRRRPVLADQQRPAVQQAQQLLPVALAEPHPEARRVPLADLGQRAFPVQLGEDEVLLGPQFVPSAADRVRAPVDLGGAAQHRGADAQVVAAPRAQGEQVDSGHRSPAGTVCDSRSARART